MKAKHQSSKGLPTYVLRSLCLALSLSLSLSAVKSSSRIALWQGRSSLRLSQFPRPGLLVAPHPRRWLSYGLPLRSGYVGSAGWVFGSDSCEKDQKESSTSCKGKQSWYETTFLLVLPCQNTSPRTIEPRPPPHPCLCPWRWHFSAPAR